MTTLRFGFAEIERAAVDWGANCGPAALAAACGLTLDDVRPHLEGFERKRYTNPTMMFGALDSLGVRWRRLKPCAWPDYGLVRVQWHGPWMADGVPRRARYRHSHWIGVRTSLDGGRQVFVVIRRRST